MATQNDFYRAFNYPACAMSAFTRVVISVNGSLWPADKNVRGIGVLQEDVSGQVWENPDVRFLGVGTCQVMATSGLLVGPQITPGATLYCVALGQVAPTSGASTNAVVTFGWAVTALAVTTGCIEAVPVLGAL
jgi:hypothetical protein